MYRQRYSSPQDTDVPPQNENRAATDDRPLPARILGKRLGNRYQFQTNQGILKNWFGARHLEPLPQGVLLLIADIIKRLLLYVLQPKQHHAILLEQFVPDCSCKTACTTKRYRPEVLCRIEPGHQVYCYHVDKDKDKGTPNLQSKEKYR